MLCLAAHAPVARAQGLERPAPATDPAVPGQIQAQSALTQSFSSTQIDNLSVHLQQLQQGFDPCPDTGKLAVKTDPETARRDVGDSPQAQPARVSSAGTASTTGTAGGPPVVQDSCLNATLFDARRSGFWFAGAMNYGTNLPVAAHNYFTSPGLTLGLDHKLADRLIVGTALGRGWNDSTLDDAGSRSNVISTQGSLYLHYEPVHSVKVDALVGYGDVAMDNRRWIDNDSSWARGSRHGTSWYGSFAMNTAMQGAGLRLEPYLRSDFVAQSLDPYSESGSNDYALGYGTTSSTLNTLSVGATALHDINLSGSTLTPVVALKYLHTLNGSQTSNLYYLGSGTGGAYPLTAILTPQIITTHQFALRYRNRYGLQGELGTGYSSGSFNLSRSYSASVRASF